MLKSFLYFVHFLIGIFFFILSFAFCMSSQYESSVRRLENISSQLIVCLYPLNCVFHSTSFIVIAFMKPNFFILSFVIVKSLNMKYWRFLPVFYKFYRFIFYIEISDQFWVKFLINNEVSIFSLIIVIQ